MYAVVGIIILIWGALALVFGIIALFNRGTSGTAGLWAAIITIAVSRVNMMIAESRFSTGMSAIAEAAASEAAVVVVTDAVGQTTRVRLRHDLHAERQWCQGAMP